MKTEVFTVVITRVPNNWSGLALERHLKKLILDAMEKTQDLKDCRVGILWADEKQEVVK